MISGLLCRSELGLEFVSWLASAGVWGGASSIETRPIAPGLAVGFG